MLSRVEWERRGKVGLDRVSNEATSGVCVLGGQASLDQLTLSKEELRSDVRGKA